MRPELDAHSHKADKCTTCFPVSGAEHEEYDRSQDHACSYWANSYLFSREAFWSRRGIRRSSFFQKVKIFLNGAIAIRRVLSGLRKRASVFTELLRRKIADICLAGFDKLYGILVICVEIIRAVENTAVRRCAEPFKILSYTVYEFIAFFYGVCVVIAKVELSAVFFAVS